MLAQKLTGTDVRFLVRYRRKSCPSAEQHPIIWGEAKVVGDVERVRIVPVAGNRRSDLLGGERARRDDEGGDRHDPSAKIAESACCIGVGRQSDLASG